MQLFPIGESDVLRNRLTHSHEVADIAVAICDRLNSDKGNDFFSGENSIDRNIVRSIGLAHDIGHPPFGHDGEVTLNTCMRSSAAGCFEGNAQTLRILTKLENRLSHHNADRNLRAVYNRPFGLNLTFRTIAGVIKYDKVLKGVDDLIGDTFLGEPNWVFPPEKGYYPEEVDLIEQVKRQVIKGYQSGGDMSLPTIECQIMDIADDIAYSTYDLEDAMVAGLTTPFDLVSPSDKMAKAVAQRVTLAMNKSGYGCKIEPSEVTLILTNIFRQIFRFENEDRYDLNNDIRDRVMFVAHSYNENIAIAQNQILRRALTEDLIQSAIRSISVQVNHENPELSLLVMETHRKLEIECLKAFNFERVINSQTSRIHAQRARHIVKFVFDSIIANPIELLPNEEYKDRYSDLSVGFSGEKRHLKAAQHRFVCDFVAEMTDEEALIFYRRILTTDRLLIHNLHHPRKA